MKLNHNKAQVSLTPRKLWLPVLVASTLAPLLATAPQALGQAAPTGQHRVTVLEEVVVTARRRAESLQDVPIAITALTEEYLSSNHIGSFNELRNHAPALNVSNAGTGVNTPVVALRGQRTSESAINLEGAVPMYLADVVLTPAAGTNLAMYDLENVQVLKGPQGTLFGRNSTGGALLFTPTSPGDTLGGYLEVKAGNYNLFETRGAVDLPASDRLMFRIAGRTVDRDPYQKNVSSNPLTRGDGYWDEQSRAVRFSMLARPSDNLDNTLIVSWDTNDTKGVQPRLEAFDPNRLPLDADLERSLGRDPMKVESDQPGQYEDVETWFVANTTEYRLGDITLKNIFGYRKVEWSSVYDSDGTALPIANMASDGLPAITNGEQFSNEFQVLGSALDERLDWIAGAYYWQMEGRRASRSNIVTPQIAFDNIQEGDADNTAYAVFAQASYEATERLGVTLGARWSWDERELTPKNRRVFAGGALVQCQMRDENNVPLPADNCARTVDDEWDAITWLASVNYHLSDRTMAYGSVTTGYRAGGFNIRGTTNAELQPFDQEEVITYELGLKADWDYAGWQFRTNLVLYHQDFDDIQRTVSLPNPDAPGAFITLTRNAAKATIRGGEVEFQAITNFGLDIALNYAYVNTEYDEYIDQHNIDQSGEPIEWVPEDQFNATLRYTLPVDPRLGDISLQASYYYQSEQLATLYTAVDPRANRVKYVDSYVVQNYSIDWKSVMGSSFDASLFIKNAGDERYPVGGLTVVESLGVALWNYGEPRTWGGSIRYRF